MTDARVNFGFGLSEDLVSPAIEGMADRVRGLKGEFLAAAKEIKGVGGEARQSLGGAARETGRLGDGLSGLGQESQEFAKLLKEGLAAAVKSAKRAGEEYRSFRGDLDKINQSLKKIAKNSRGLGVALRSAILGVGSFLGTLGANAIGGGLKLLGKGLYEAVTGFGRLKDSAVQASLDAERAMRPWRTQIQGAGLDVKELNKQVKDISRASEFGRDSVRSAQAVFAPTAGGSTQKVAEDTRLAADIAARAGRDVREAAQLLVQIRQGQASQDDLFAFGVPQELIRQAEARRADAARSAEISNRAAPGSGDATVQRAIQTNAGIIEGFLARESAGAAKKNASFGFGQTLRDESKNLLALFGGSFVEGFKESQGGRIEKISKLNDLLENAPINDTIQELLELFRSGEFSSQISEVFNDLKGLGIEIVNVLASAVKFAGQVVLESIRIGSAYIEDAIVKAIRNVPGLGGIRSRIEKFNDGKAFSQSSNLSLKEQDKAARDFLELVADKKGVGFFEKNKLAKTSDIIDDYFNTRSIINSEGIKSAGSVVTDFSRLTPRQAIDLARRTQELQASSGESIKDPAQFNIGGAFTGFVDNAGASLAAANKFRQDLVAKSENLLIGAVEQAVAGTSESKAGPGRPFVDVGTFRPPLASGQSPEQAALLAESQRQVEAAIQKEEAERFDRAVGSWGALVAEGRRANIMRQQRNLAPAGAYA